MKTEFPLPKYLFNLNFILHIPIIYFLTTQGIFYTDTHLLHFILQWSFISIIFLSSSILLLTSVRKKDNSLIFSSATQLITSSVFIFAFLFSNNNVMSDIITVIPIVIILVVLPFKYKLSKEPFIFNIEKADFYANTISILSLFLLSEFYC